MLTSWQSLKYCIVNQALQKLKVPSVQTWHSKRKPWFDYSDFKATTVDLEIFTSSIFCFIKFLVHLIFASRLKPTNIADVEKIFGFLFFSTRANKENVLPLKISRSTVLAPDLHVSLPTILGHLTTAQACIRGWFLVGGYPSIKSTHKRNATHKHSIAMYLLWVTHKRTTTMYLSYQRKVM